MEKLDALRKIIREEVKAVFREEISGILKEAIITNRDSKSIVESNVPRKSQVPSTLNTRPIAQKLTPPVLSPGNPLNSILAETAMAMNPEDYGNLGDIDVMKEVPIVESVDQMFASARKSSNLEAIEINAVPDFSHMIAKMGI
jgi:hypothetical protein